MADKRSGGRSSYGDLPAGASSFGDRSGQTGPPPALGLTPPQAGDDPRKLGSFRVPAQTGGPPQGGLMGAQLKPGRSDLKQTLLGLMADPGLAPMALGVVAESFGGQKLVARLIGEAKHYPASMPENERLQRSIIRYFQLKYPKFFASSSGVMFDPTMAAGDLGAFGQTSKLVRINPKEMHNAAESAEAIAHETTHGIQHQRNPKIITPVEQGGEYISPPKDIKTLGDYLKFIQYRTQQAETEARQGGETAKRTFRKYVKQYPELREVFGLDIYPDEPESESIFSKLSQRVSDSIYGKGR